MEYLLKIKDWAHGLADAGVSLIAQIAASGLSNFNRAGLLATPVDSKGLNVDINSEWNVALDNIPESMQQYVSAALRRSTLNTSKNIKISTIHASKGGEADNVMLLTDLPRKADLSVSTKRDDERRVFYVGATRAKKSLHIIESKTNREFGELL